jgi:hypothetical protein
MVDVKHDRSLSEPLTTCGHDPRPEYRAFNLIPNFVERVHKSLDPNLKDFVHELSDSFFCLWTGWIVWYGC